VTGDYKSALQEFLQSRDDPPPEYVVVGHEGPDHARVFDVEVRAGGRTLGRATGRSKKEAAQEAARLALIALGVTLA